MNNTAYSMWQRSSTKKTEPTLGTGSGDDHALQASSQLLQKALGLAPVTRRHYNDLPMLIEAYHITSKSGVILPRGPKPFMGIQLEGKKVTFAPSESNNVLHTLPNQCVLIPPGAQTHWMPPSGCVMAGVFMGGQADLALRKIIGAGTEPVLLDAPLLSAIIRQLLNFTNHEPSAANTFEASLVNCFVEYLEWHALAPMDTRHPRLVSGAPEMSRVLLFINDHIEEPLTIEVLAAKTNMAESLFCKRFLETTGMTVHRYVLKTRIECARKLISDSNLPLVSVSLQCGFSSQSHMTKVFRNELGATPAELRRKV